MREVKFRAWDRKKGVMVGMTGTTTSRNPLGVDLADYYLLISFDGVLHDGCYDRLDYDLDNSRFELMQFTGLHDKNGVESYFDDIIKWQDSTFRIIWDDECATVMLRRLSGNDGMREIPPHNIKQGTNIGNIWESPELLEKGG